MNEFDDKTRVPGDALGSKRTELGKYELLAQIGSGGMAKVYLARQRGPVSFEKLVVVKTIHAHLARNDQFVNMFLDEARIAAQISHPNVVQVFDLGIEDGTYFIVMEYLPGEALSTVIEASLKTQRPLPPLVCARVIARVAEGLHAAHELKSMAGEPLDVVHRDVTPGNILVMYDGRVKVVDFGVAKARGRLAETQGGQLKGKLSYMSPEQIHSRPVDRRSDVFATGVVLWEMLALRRLFRRSSNAATLGAVTSKAPKPPSHFRSRVSAALDAITLRALEKGPATRYQTSKDLQVELDAISAGNISDVDISDWMHETFGSRIDTRVHLIERLVSGGQPLDPDELQTMTTVLTADGSGSLSLPQPSTGEYGIDSGWDAAGDQPANDFLFDGSDEDSLVDGDLDDPISNEDSDIFEDMPTAAKSGPVDSIESFYEDGFFDVSEVIPPRRSRAPIVLGLIAAAGLLFGAGTISRWVMAPKPKPIPLSIASTEGNAAAVFADDESSPATTGDRQLSDPANADQANVNDVAGPNSTPPEPAHRPAARRGARSGRGAKGKAKAGNSAEAKHLYEEGTRSFVKGDHSGAERKFKAAIAVDRSFAPAHRGLGLLYERGDKKVLAAKHLRIYLRMAPWASDAAATRKRLDSLK